MPHILNLYSSPSIFWDDKARRIRLAGEREEVNVGFTWGEHGRKRTLGRLGLRWEDNIEIYFR
jgi:hypothetical protein